jgi:ElaB/YqjD/DUF883 family membrane-anchored ribosome-binding protein
MKTSERNAEDELAHLANEAGALMAATLDVAGDRVAEARVRLAAALDRGRHLYGEARACAVAGGQAANHAVHEHPYRTVAVGVGLGLLAGYLWGHRRPTKSD